MIWFSLAKMAMKTGAEVYKNKQESKQLQSLAERNYSERMAKGEVDFKVKTLDAQSGSIKDEIVLFIVILPILVISYSVFSGSPDAKEKLDLFFGDHQITKSGCNIENYDESLVKKYMKNESLIITINLGIGNHDHKVWTCDLSHKYIDINTDYRS